MRPLASWWAGVGRASAWARTAALALTLSACESESFSFDSDDVAAGEDFGDTFATEDDAPAVAGFRLQVVPSTPDASGRPILPQVLGPFGAGSVFDLTVDPTVVLSGRAVAGRVLPFQAAALMPTSPTPVRGRLRAQRLRDGAVFDARADEDGRFALELLPGSYRMELLPEQAGMPLMRQIRFVDADETLTWSDTTGGVPVWGRITDADGQPVAGATVTLRGELGLTLPPVTTDAGGFYELRAVTSPSQPIDVVVAPPTARRLPTLTRAAILLGDDGARVDVAWPATETVDVSLRTEDEDGMPAAGVLVTFTATSLTGYGPEATPAFAVTASADSLGLVSTRLPEGVYAIEAVPDADGALSATRLGGVPVAPAAPDLGALTLGPVAETAGRVRAVGGVPLADVSVACSETLGDRRSWATTSGVDGAFSVRLPTGPWSCLLQPPDPTLGSALVLGGAPDAPGELFLGAGDLVQGVVRLPDGTGLPDAIVRLLDDDDRVRAIAITGGDGGVRIQVERVLSPAADR